MNEKKIKEIPLSKDRVDYIRENIEKNEKINEIKRILTCSFKTIVQLLPEDSQELSHEIGFQHANILNKIEEILK